MTAPNANTLWAQTIVDELVHAGVSRVCITPGSRSTPLVIAFTGHEAVDIFSHLDERAAAYFALGQAKQTGEPTALVCTSGTAIANYHPAIIEADNARTPLIALTADRPPELHESGANQTIDQENFYGHAVRWYRTLGEPAASARKLRGLRTTVARAVATATRPPAGPVHLNIPFRKPLEPTPTGEIPDDFARDYPLAAEGRHGPYVKTTAATRTIDETELDQLAQAITETPRGLIVTGPTTGVTDQSPLADLAAATGYPLLADPLSGLRFGDFESDAQICGGYDAYLTETVTADWPDPALVLRFGASPTSKTLRQYLAETSARQLLVDPAGDWREASFTASDLVEADPEQLARSLATRIDQSPGAWGDRFQTAEETHWTAVNDTSAMYEGGILKEVVDTAPDPATIFAGNSMPVRDLDRFGRPRAADLSVLGNRGASGIDGTVSTALGAGSTTDATLIAVLGDLAYYHDMNGLLALSRCNVDATIVVINNDGGGIFHKLPIADFDPPFTDHFKTPHGLDFSPTADIYEFTFTRVDTLEDFTTVYSDSFTDQGPTVIEVQSDAEASHQVRERLQTTIVSRLTE